MIIKQTLNIKPQKTFRSEAVRQRFDISDQALNQVIEANVPIEGLSYNVGLIVGGSGTGKTTIANQLFGPSEPMQWDENNLIDNFEPDLSLEDIVQTLGSVGFNAPPFWLKPFSVLSNGEKMRVQLAREILSKKRVIFDEFTSVVDRDVAKATSFSIQKLVRKLNKQFVAISCHYDVIDWLAPDWTLDTNTMSFFLTKNSSDPSSNTRLKNALSPYGSSLKTITI